jgi:hypothetical protein
MNIDQQTASIRRHLSAHPEGLTALDALNLFGCFRLSARIYDIRNGADGEAPLEVKSVREGRHARYVLA